MKKKQEKVLDALEDAYTKGLLDSSLLDEYGEDYETEKRIKSGDKKIDKLLNRALELDIEPKEIEAIFEESEKISDEIVDESKKED